MNNQNPQENKNKSFLERFSLSDGLIIAFFTSTAYIIYFCYYLGYFDYFSIPLSYLDFNKPFLFSTAILFSFIGVLAILFKESILDFYENRFLQYDEISTTFLFILYFSIITTLVLWGQWLIVAGAIFSIIIILIINYLLLSRKNIKSVHRGETQKHESKFGKRSDIDAPTDGFSNARRKLDESTGVLLLIGFFFIVMGIGRLSAYYKADFDVLNSSPECVILYTSSERVICYQVNRAEKEVEPSYRVVYFEDIQNLTIRQENLGPLHLQPTTTQTPLPTYTPTNTRIPLPIQTQIQISTITP